MPFYAITKKNGWRIVHLILNLLCIEGMFMIFLFFFHLKNISNIFPFLDINITRQYNQLETSVYRKPTFSGVYTHYESYIDQSYKKSLIFTLLFLCCSLCSDYTLFHLEVEKIGEILNNNNYPSGVI